MSNYTKEASYNVNGLLNPVKRSKILTKLKEKIEIALLQETHLNVTEHNKLNRMGFKYISLLHLDLDIEEGLQF